MFDLYCSSLLAVLGNLDGWVPLRYLVTIEIVMFLVICCCAKDWHPLCNIQSMMNYTHTISTESEKKSPCSFPLYAAARLVVQAHRPYLDELGLTYPQYLIIQALSKESGLTVTQIADSLFLDAGTVTPILKRLQKRGVILRERSKKDERAVLNHLTDEGAILAFRSSGIAAQALNRGLMRPELVEPLIEEAQSLLGHLTVSKL